MSPRGRLYGLAEHVRLGVVPEAIGRVRPHHVAAYRLFCDRDVDRLE